MTLGLGLGLSFGQGPSTPFVPTNVNGCKLWLRADKGITIATGVSAWADQSGTADANKNCVQATGSAQPTLNASDAAYNYQATLSFASAASQFLLSGTWAVALAQPYTIIVVGNTDGTATAQGLLGCLSPVVELTTNNGGAALDIYAGAVLNAGVGNSSSPRVFGAAFNGASSKTYVSAKTPTATGDAGAHSLASTSIGCDPGPAHYLNGKIAEVIVYSGALNTTNVNALLTYFGTRYNITIGP